MLKKIFTITNKRYVANLSTNTKPIEYGLLLTRLPIVTKESTPFEQKYWDYQETKFETNSLPFSSELYFKKGSLNERQWKEHLQFKSDTENEGKVDTKGEDEIDSETSKVDDSIFSTEFAAKNSRVTDADKKNDLQSLERKLDSSLYLLLKLKNNQKYTLPSFQNDLNETEAKDLPIEELSKSLALKNLGENLDILTLGQSPIFYLEDKADGKLKFFIKGIITSGQIDALINKNKGPFESFVWVAKSELSTYLDKEVYNKIKDILD